MRINLIHLFSARLITGESVRWVTCAIIKVRAATHASITVI